MKLVAVLTVAFGITQVVSGQHVFNPNGATYSCLNDNVGNAADDGVIFEYTEDNINDTYVQAFILGQQTNAECRADKSGGVITLNVTIGTCGLVADGDNVVTVHVLLVQTAGFVTEWDYKFYFHCDFDEQTMQNVTANLTSILDNTQNGTVVQKVEDVSLNVQLDGTTDGSTLQTCTLGQDINLRLDLVPSTSAVGTYGISCVVKPTMDSTRELAFISDRCAVTSANGGLANFQGYLDADTGFGVNAVTTGFSSPTGPFKCFRFSDSDSLYFQCKVGFCSVRDLQCDTDNCVANQGRRRRDVDESKTEELIFRLDITSGSTTRIPTPVRNEPNSPAECKPDHIYMYNTAFIAVIAILAVLLVVSMGSTMFVCMRKRHVRSGEKGEDNAAF